MENNKVLEFKSKLIDKGLDVSEFEDIINEIKEGTEEREYGLVWEDNVEEVEEELKYKTPILKEEGSLRIYKGEEYTDNLLIEGDNLESLTYLKNEGRKVDLIYLDPPYNTLSAEGSFVYKDRRLNKEDSYRHSSWISFMEKRLRLARELLTEDGIIFISIDDRELYNLKLLCDIIFGETNFISSLVWKSSTGGGIRPKHVSVSHQYVLFYAKNKGALGRLNAPMTPDIIKGYSYKDDKGDYRIDRLAFRNPSKNKNQYFYICMPDGTWARPKKGYISRFKKESYLKLVEEGMVVFKKTGGKSPFEEEGGKQSDWNVYIKKYIGNATTAPVSILPSELIGLGNEGSKSVEDVLGSKVFDYPKPTSLMRYLIYLHPNKNATILDFFAGSGTTGHAVLELNKEDGGNRNFILCTNNENKICRDVTYQRLNKVINGYTTPKGKEVEGITANLKYYKTELVSKEENE